MYFPPLCPGPLFDRMEMGMEMGMEIELGMLMALRTEISRFSKPMAPPPTLHP